MKTKSDTRAREHSCKRTRKPVEERRAVRANETRSLPMADVYPNPSQPRTIFERSELEELAESIRQHGLLQPIKVRPDGTGKYMIVLGERRWRAQQLLGAAKIVATITDCSDDELADAAIVENLQRKDISPLEEPRAYQARLDTGISVEELAQRIGLKQPWRITERVALLKLAPEFQDAFAKGIITPSQATEMGRLSHGYQRVLMNAITARRCKSYQELRAVAMALASEQGREQPNVFVLGQKDEPQSGLLPGFDEPTPEQRQVLTRLEKKIENVVGLLQGGFKENEIVIVRKISPAHADMALPLDRA
jgi:ParB family transcriptional regulator, chromosome partitioning protein